MNMNQEVQAWQRDAKKAFDWIDGLYGQAERIWKDARGLFTSAGWRLIVTNGAGGLGGMAQSAGDLSDWPFCFFKAFGAVPTKAGNLHPNRAAFFGFAFHGRADGAGPTCVAGTVDRGSLEARCDQWCLAAAVGIEPESDLLNVFEVTGDGVRRSAPSPTKASAAPGVEAVRWFEVPLGSIDSAERLKAIVDAAIALHADDEAPARKLVASSAVAP